MTTTTRTEWRDADNRLIRCPGEALAVFTDGPHAGWRVVTCRGDHPPLMVEITGRGQRTAKYRRDDTMPKLTYRVVIA